VGIFQYENRSEPLASTRVFVRRVALHGGAAAVLVLAALLVGMVGYRATEGMAWIDAFVNASMILSGMGPVGELHHPAGKIFAGCYAIFSGVALLVIVASMLAPAIHRMLHRLHVDDSES